MLRIEMHAQALDKGEIGMVTGERKNLFRREPLFAAGIADHNFLRVMSFTCVSKSAWICPALILFSISGFTNI